MIKCVWVGGYTVDSVKNVGEHIIVGRVHFPDWERSHSLVNMFSFFLLIGR